ncbi:DUF397 domain-containing protein [Saccharopolyspora shandongensis]|uniref:DUF397 domain-containing protein n=1 Tax=Saccharopolyspora shandongensis TaxID=418495 RepID=A0A1H3API2_9PSEU|nr:DUF397 domain-containing protein [Saccharopolyspora shandongensis]SDX31495.1 protein of unknown function [Saccharopolyspora shandongensis]
MRVTAHFSDETWRTSSRCGPNNANCLAVNHDKGTDLVGLRDTKLSDSPVLVFVARQWWSFLASARAGVYDR